MKRKAFERTLLDEERDSRYKNLTIRLNEQDVAMLKEMAEVLDVKELGRVFKYLSWVGRNALQGTFGFKILKKLMRRERSRLSDLGKISTDV